MTEKKFPAFSLGADPEFILEFRGQMIGADEIIEGCSDEPDEGIVGLDGCSRTAELRPKYAYTPIGLVENIQGAIRNSVKEFPRLAGVKWLAGAHKHGEPIGGHIHFGVDETTWENANITKALDIFLSGNLMQIESPKEAKNRKASYGSLADVREQAWGMEYRSPSCWLGSPMLAYGVLSLAKHIVNQALMDKTFFYNLNYSEILFAKEEAIWIKYTTHDVNFFRMRNAAMWEEIMSWPVEPGLEEGLNIMRTLVEKGIRFNTGNMLHNWGLSVEISK